MSPTVHTASFGVAHASSAAQPGVTVRAAGGELGTAWDNFTSLLPNNFLIGLAVVGIAIVVFSVFAWFWANRRGGKLQWRTLPWLAIIVGLAFAAPKTVIPLVLSLIDILWVFASALWENLVRLVG
ncbi:MAG: hypothetical protein V4737_14710 [Curtobacterium sp.]